MHISTVKTPSCEPVGPAYPFNRGPLMPNPFTRLPLGAVQPKGWIRHQLDLMARGMIGRLGEISPFLKDDNGWFGTDNHGWEEQPYWFRGFYDLGILTGEKSLMDEGARWIAAILDSQDKSGYFGPRAYKKITGEREEQEICDLWPHMVMLDAVIHYHEFTGDPRVIPFMRSFFSWCRDLPDSMFMPQLHDRFWGGGHPWPQFQYLRAGDMLPHIYWTYNRTGDPWLLNLATRFYSKIPAPQSEWLDHHVINFTQRFAYPGIYAAQSGKQWHVDQSEYWYMQHMATWGQQPRGIFAADEQIRDGQTDPRQGFETCGFGEFARNFYLLGQLTGATRYADRVEDLLFNHFPASMTPDLRALHYLTASNQPQLDASEEHEYFNKGRMISYSPGERYRCCQHNVAMTWPWFAEHLWLATADGGLAAWMYGPCAVSAKTAGGAEVSIIQDTGYPFKNDVTLTVNPDRETAFPLYLRTPAWCREFSACINGQAANAAAAPGDYLRIERTWKPGDTVSIRMPMQAGVTRWPRNGSVTIDRGPLSYSVKIGENYRRCGGTDAWPEWEVLPETPWNYGLILDRDEMPEGLAIKEKAAVANQPWTPDAAPVEITVKARRVPQWELVNQTADTVPQSPVRSDAPEENITLIPLGCARLRMSCLPVVETPVS